MQLMLKVIIGFSLLKLLLRPLQAQNPLTDRFQQPFLEGRNENFEGERPGEENELIVLPGVVLISLPSLISLQKFSSQGGLCSGELPWSSCHRLVHEIPLPYVHRELSALFVFLLELYAKTIARFSQRRITSTMWWVPTKCKGYIC